MAKTVKEVSVAVTYSDGTAAVFDVRDVKQFMVDTRCEIEGPTEAGPGWQTHEPTGRHRVEVSLSGVGTYETSR